MDLNERLIREFIQTLRELEEERTGAILRELRHLNTQLTEVQQTLREDCNAVRQIGAYLRDYQGVADYRQAHPEMEDRERMHDLKARVIRTGSLLAPDQVGISALNNTRTSQDEPFVYKTKRQEIAENTRFGVNTTDRAFYRPD